MKWKKTLALLSVMFCAFSALAAEDYEGTAEWQMVVMLKADAARCSIDNGMLRIEMRKRGTPADVDAAFKKSRACVDAALPKGREHYRSALQAVPASKPMLTKAYAAWMTYMETLSMPIESEEQAAAQAALQAAVSEVKAELDAR